MVLARVQVSGQSADSVLSTQLIVDNMGTEDSCYTVASVAGAGRGLVAARDIQQGEQQRARHGEVVTSAVVLRRGARPRRHARGSR